MPDFYFDYTGIRENIMKLYLLIVLIWQFQMGFNASSETYEIGSFLIRSGQLVINNRMSFCFSGEWNVFIITHDNRPSDIQISTWDKTFSDNDFIYIRGIDVGEELLVCDLYPLSSNIPNKPLNPPWPLGINVSFIFDWDFNTGINFVLNNPDYKVYGYYWGSKDSISGLRISV
jgi:hypothetical protein